MQPNRLSGAIGADLQHLSRGNRNGRTPAEIERILIRDDGAERIVASAQIQDDEVARAYALCQRDVTQERGRGKADGECRHAIANELSS